MLKIEDVIKALEGIENGADLIEALKSELSKKNNEAANLRKRAKTAEDANAEDKKKLLAVLEKLGIDGTDDEEFDLDEALEAFIKSNQAGGKGKGKDDPEFAALTAQVSKLTKQITGLQKDKETSDKLIMEERGKRHAILVKNELMEALSEGKAIKPSTMVDVLSKFIKVGDDEKLVFTNDVGEDVPVKDGVAGWLKANPEFVQNTSTGGAGSHGGGPGGKQTDVDQAKAFADARNKGQDAPAGGLNIWGANK